MCQCHAASICGHAVLLAVYSAIVSHVLCDANLRGGCGKLGSHGAASDILSSLPFPPNGQLFYSRYAHQSRPVLFRNAASDWPAFKNWSNITYLKEEYGSDVFTVEFRKQFASTFPIRKNMKLSSFLDDYEKKDLYLDSLFSKVSQMTKDVYMPLPLLSILHKVSVDNLNLLISSGNTSSAFHQDGYENFLTVVSGYKNVILYDGRYARDFDADNYNIAAGVLDLNPENLRENDCKILEGVPFYTATLQPGDMLYIPKYWWHQVRSFDNPNIAVGIWFDIFDFQKEFNERDIIDEEHVVQKTELFMELLAKEPNQIPPLESLESNAVNFMSPRLPIVWKNVCHQKGQSSPSS